MKQFDIPSVYQSSFIASIKDARKNTDPRKKDFTPSKLDFGSVQLLIARHFGFCYGVENAIEISYKAVEENPGKRIFLLSQMIHNPAVNNNLRSLGIQFIMDTQGHQFIAWDEIQSGDIVIVPAFGTTLEIESLLKNKGVDLKKYDTTCPFVTKVWKQSEKLGTKGYTVIIHGKHLHEETRATFSHSTEFANSLVVKNMDEAKMVGAYILGEMSEEAFTSYFKNYYSELFNPKIHLEKVGVVNQTTMLASDTQAIADYFKTIMKKKYGEENLMNHFADTRDTLCYATNDNQQATIRLLQETADIAIVVGGFNSSNTSHLVELCEEKLPTYFISSADEIISKNKIRHFNYSKKQILTSENYLPQSQPLKIILTSGASCPDAIVDGVIDKLLSFFELNKNKLDVLNELTLNAS
tara:strand:+ start:1615 stop:2847 length:1233 start_codon:yes stop_codon:yes gene_type:complete